jgi:hypothetical protein
MEPDLELQRSTLAEILTLTRALDKKVDTLMSAEADLQAQLDAIQSGLAAVGTRITNLVTGLAAGQVVTQAQLDAMTTEATSIAAAVTALGTPGPTGRK